MKLEVFKKINISKGLTIFNKIEYKESFKTVEELSDSIIFRYKNLFPLNCKSDIHKLKKLIKKLSSEFVINKKNYEGFVVIDKNYTGNAIEYLWQNAETSQGFKEILGNIKNGVKINQIIDKTSFYNKILSISFISYQRLERLWDNLSDHSIYFKKMNGDRMIKISNNKYSFTLDRPGTITCLAKPRIKKGVKIFDYIFKAKDFNNRPTSRLMKSHPKRRIKQRRTTDLISIYDGKLLILNDEIVQDFSENGFIKVMPLSENDKLSMLTKTKYIIKKKTQDKNEIFEENVYFVSKDPDIILYDDFKVIGAENNNINMVSRIEDNIYHPDNISNQVKKFNLLTLGVIDDFFD